MRVLFLCPHGGAKSVMAASYFNRLAEHLALPYDATAAATEDPYETVPRPVADLLERDGIDVRQFTPRRVESRDLGMATRAIAIGCSIPDAMVERWDDVPAASEDLEGSSSAIRRHVEALVAELRERQ